jgi:integrase
MARDEMSRIRLKFVHSFVDRHGRARFYVRRKGHRKVPLPGLPGSFEFMAAYAAATAVATPSIEVGAKKRSHPGSLSSAVAAYYTSHAFTALAPSTQGKQRGVLERFREAHGDKPMRLLPRKFIIQMLAPMKPFEATNTLKAIRKLCQFCLDHEMIDADPTLGIKIKVPRSDGHQTWSEAEIAQYEAAHPLGTKARLALSLGLYTAQRRGDVIRMGPQHVRDGALTVRQGKTGTGLLIPVLDKLQAAIDAAPTKHLTFLTTKTGRAYAACDFSIQFRAWCDEAGLPAHCVFHGLRKAALTRLAGDGCSVHEIAAISGHKSLREVQRYTQAVDQMQLARAAMAKKNKREQEGGQPDAPPVANLSKINEMER